MRTQVISVGTLVAALLACKSEDKGAGPAQPVATVTVPAATAPATAAQPAAPAPAPAPKDEGPVPAIPEGRSKPPTVTEWKDAPSINTQEANSQPDKCFMKLLREWLKVNCSANVTEVKDMDGFGSANADYFESVTLGKSADFVVRVRKGKTMRLRIMMDEPKQHGASLFVNWPPDKDRPTIIALGRM